jgi:hypothetical protein
MAELGLAALRSIGRLGDFRGIFEWRHEKVPSQKVAAVEFSINWAPGALKSFRGWLSSAYIPSEERYEYQWINQLSLKQRRDGTGKSRIRWARFGPTSSDLVRSPWRLPFAVDHMRSTACSIGQ